MLYSFLKVEACIYHKSSLEDEHIVLIRLVKYIAQNLKINLLCQKIMLHLHETVE